MRDTTDLLMAGYIGFTVGLSSLIAVFAVTICPGWDPLEGGNVPVSLFFMATPVVVFSLAGWVAGRLWRIQSGSATWPECALAAPSTWAAPALFVFLQVVSIDLGGGSWLHPVWLLWFVPPYLTTYLGLRSKPKPPPGHCPRCGYDLTGNVSGRCPECARPIPLSQRVGSDHSH